MPIYVYQCKQCGAEHEAMQKISDALLSECPKCHAQALRKKVTAAGFQLKGSGWYVTDFRGGSQASSESSSAKNADTVSTATTHGSETKPNAQAKPETTTQSTTSKSESSSTAP